MPERQGPTRARQVANRSEATRAALISAARLLFVRNGYFNTGTEEIVAEAGVGTRGALYHHFPDKQSLFQAVFQTVEEDLLDSASQARHPGGAVAQLRAGLLGFLEAAANSREVQQVLLIDGPAVLGWQTWRALEAQYGLGAVRALLEQAVTEGALVPQPTEVLAHLLLAAVDEAALYIANSEDPATAQVETVATMSRLLDGITQPP